MAFIRNIANQTLTVNGKEASFAVKTLQDIELEDEAITHLPHRHSFYTIFWAIEVSGNQRIDLQNFVFENNSVFFIHPDQVHQVQAEKGAKGIEICFTRDFLIRNNLHQEFIDSLQLFQLNEFAQSLNTAEIHEELNYLLEKMIGINQISTFGELKFATYLQLFLIRCSEQTALKTILNTSTKPDIVQQFKSLINENYSEQHLVKNYADKLLISANYLNEIVKKSTGRNAKDHIQQRLLAEAKRLELFTNLSAKEIGFKLGFNDPSHFAKFLKKYSK